MTRGNQSVTYRLTAATSGQAGLQKFTDTLERLLGVQDRIKAQGDVIAGLQAQVAPALAASRAQAQEEIRLARETAAAKKAAANDYGGFRKRQLSEEEQAERAAQQAGMQRLRDRAATWRLNARLAADSERQAQVAIAETIRSLDNQQRAQRNLWQSGKILAIDAVEGQRKIQAQALAAAAALDKESDAYRRLTGVAAAAERTTNSALGRNTPGGFSHGVTLGIQNSGLMNMAALYGGPSAQALGIVASSFTDAKKAALDYGAASNTAATATGVMTAAGAALTLGVGALAVGLGSLGKVGLEQVGILQGGLNVLSANGVQDLEAVQRQIDSLKVNLGQVGKSFTTADLTASAADIVKAGVSVDQAMQVMAGSTKLAAAEQTNLNDASGQLLKNLRQYELDLSRSGEVADMFAKAGNLAAGSANDLSVGFGIVGTTGRQARIEMYDLLGMLVELDNKGMDAADVGANGLRTAIAALGDPTDKARGILAGLRIELEDSAGKARPAGDVMKDLGERMRGMGITVNAATGELEGNGEALRTVSGLMDTRAAAAVLALTGDWKTYGQQVKNSAGYADEYANTMTQGVIPAQDRVRVAFADAGLALAKGFAGPLADLLDDVVTPGIETLGRFVTALNEVKSPGDLKATLKITTDDDFTSAVMKLLIGGGQVVKQGLLTPAPGQQNAFELLKGLLPAAPDLTLKRLPAQPLIGQPSLGLPGGSMTLPPIIISGPDLVTALGLGGRTSGTPYGQPYGPQGSWGLHNGEDYFAKTGSDLTAPFTGYVQTRWSETTGHLIEMIDAQGQKLLLGHLDHYAAGLEDAIAAAGGKLLVKQGQVLGAVGQTGSLAHKDLGPGNAHVHVMAYLPDGTVVDPKTVKFVPLVAPTAGTPWAAAGAPAAPALSPNARLRAAIDEGKHLIAQYQLALQSGNEVWQAKANAALEQWKKTHKEALGGVKDELAALGNVQRRGSAGADRPEETDLQREQRVRAEAVALDKLTASIRKASAARLDAIIAGGVQQEGDLQRINLAEAELSRRGKLTEQAAAQAKTAREKAARDGDQAAKDALATQVRMAEQAAADLARVQKEQRDTAARVAKEARALNVDAAEQALNRLKELNTQELDAFKGTATQRLTLIKRQSQAEYDAAAQVAQAKKASDLRDSANLGGPNQDARDALIRSAYTDALTVLAGDRRAAVQAALQDVNDAATDRAVEGMGASAERTQNAVTAWMTQKKAIIETRDAYKELADGIRARIAAGTFDAEAQQQATKAFNDLGRAAVAAGLDTETHVEGARKSVWGLIQAGEEAKFFYDQLDLGGAIVDPETGTLLYQTEEQIRGIGQAGSDTAEDFYDLGNAIENLGTYSKTDLETFITKSGVAADVAERLRDAWRAIFGKLDTGPQLPDNLQGRGVTNEPGYDDPASGVLTEKDKTDLIARMDTMNLDDIGQVYADLILKGFKESDLGKLMADYLQQQADAITQSLEEFGGVSFGPDGAPVYQTDADVRGQTPGSGTGEGSFYDASAVDVTQFGSMKELQGFIDKAGLADDAAQSLRERWQEQNAALLDMIKGYDDAGNAIYYTDEELRNLDPTLQGTTETVRDLTGAQKTLAGLQREVAQALGETQTPYAAQIETLEELKETYPELTAQIDQLIAALRELQDASAQQSGFNQLKQNIQQVGQIVQELFSLFGAQQTAQGIGELTSAVTGGMEAFTKFTTGDILGGVMAAIGALGNLGKAIDNLNPAIIRQKKEWAELAQQEQQAMGSKMVGGSFGMNGFANPYYDALKADSEALTRKVNAGFWERLGWDLFGNAPQTLDKAVSESLQRASAVFNDFGQSLYSTMENELMTAIDTGDFSTASMNVGKMLDKFVQRMFVQALIAKSRLGDLAKQLADDVAAGRDTSSTRAQIQAETDAVIGQAEAAAPSLSGAGAGANTSADAPANSPAGDPVVGSTFYVANSSKIDLFDNVIARADAMYLRHEGVLTLHSAAMTAHAAALDRSTAMYDRLLRDGVPLKDSQGGLAAVLR